MTVVVFAVGVCVGMTIGAIYVYWRYVLPAITATENYRTENVRLRAELDAWQRATGEHGSS